MIRNPFRKINDSPPTACQGLAIQLNDPDSGFNRDVMIMLKSLMVYLLVLGTTGTFLSAVGVAFDALPYAVVVTIAVFLLALFYRGKKLHDSGSFLYLGLTAAFIVIFREYADTGFAVVMNRFAGLYGAYFNISDVKTYIERMDDKVLSVTSFAIIWALMLIFFLMQSVIYRTGRIAAFLLTFIPLIPVMYLRVSPSPLYAIMYITGIALIFVVKSSGHYRIPFTRNGFMKIKGGYSYGNSPASFVQFTGMMATVFIVCVSMICFMPGSRQFFDELPDNRLKNYGSDVVKNVFTLGLDGLFNRYPAVGGLNSGRLGGISSIRNDGKADLKVTFAPSSSGSVYLKSATYDRYHPWNNYWTSSKGIGAYTLQQEAASLKRDYEDKKPAASVSSMKIVDVGAGTASFYPYYTERVSIKDKTENVTYYPLAGERYLESKKSENTKEDLYVPDDLKEDLKVFCRQAGLYKGMPSQYAAYILKRYFQENYPYTLNPGATPENSDFISYFLMHNKKGCCSHFASASVMIMRYLGIPARYCEGYVIPYSLVKEKGKTIDQASYREYHRGLNRLKDNNVVQVDVPDSCAHAWAEVFIEGFGWVQEEFTPASMAASASSTSDMIARLRKLIIGDKKSDDGNMKDKGINEILRSDSGRGIPLLICIIAAMIFIPIAVFFIRHLIEQCIFMHKMRGTDRNGRLMLILKRDVGRLKKKYNSFGEVTNIKELIRALAGDDREVSGETAEVTSVVLLAGFSDKEISENDYRKAIGWLKRKVRKFVKCNRR